MTDCFYLQLYTFHYYLNLLECTNVLFFISPNITGADVWGKERSEMDEMCVMCQISVMLLLKKRQGKTSLRKPGNIRSPLTRAEGG